MPSRRRKVELVRARALSPSVRSLVFRFADGAPFAFEPGQYVDLYARVASGFVFKRPYSIASPPGEDLELAVTRVADGPMSTALHAMPPGERAEIFGPAGVFRMRGERERPALFVATGSGLAPLRAMLARDLAEPGGGARVLLFGVRTEADILWKEELEAWAREHPRFRLEPTLSRPAAAWRGRTGYVQRHLAEEVAALGTPHVYVCGLSRMTDEVTRALERDLGVPHDRVSYETFD
jgi:ferredoxin-NADP reductase